MIKFKGITIDAVFGIVTVIFMQLYSWLKRMFEMPSGLIIEALIIIVVGGVVGVVAGGVEKKIIARSSRRIFKYIIWIIAFLLTGITIEVVREGIDQWLILTIVTGVVKGLSMGIFIGWMRKLP